jgi:hypothetical protein
LFDSISLCVSLCDTCALIGDTRAVPKLMQALQLKHRRIQVEAAYALAKLKVDEGHTQLVALASDPVSRTRSIAYCEELGLADQIAEEHRTSLAMAESQLVQWLSQVEQMGFPPTEMELVDQRTMLWPGYESPQECFLFRFTFATSHQPYSNLGIAGPVAKAFGSDLANLPIDDVFSIFVGWDIEHPEVIEKDANRLATSEQSQVELWREALGESFGTIEIEHCVSFFGKTAILGYGVRGADEGAGRRQAFLYDGEELLVQTALPTSSDALMLIYYQWRGQEFQRAF